MVTTHETISIRIKSLVSALKIPKPIVVMDMKHHQISLCEYVQGYATGKNQILQYNPSYM